MANAIESRALTVKTSSCHHVLAQGITDIVRCTKHSCMSIPARRHDSGGRLIIYLVMTHARSPYNHGIQTSLERLVAIRGLVCGRKTQVSATTTSTKGARRLTLVVGANKRNPLQDILLHAPRNDISTLSPRGNEDSPRETYLEDRNRLRKQRDACADPARPEDDGGLVVLDASAAERMSTSVGGVRGGGLTRA